MYISDYDDDGAKTKAKANDATNICRERIKRKRKRKKERKEDGRRCEIETKN